MIKKSLLAALVMLGAYHLLLPHLSHKLFQLSGQQRANYLRAQNYIYAPHGATAVIVGSSMSQELNDQILGPHYYNLSLSGGSLYTGLEIICRSNQLPKIVLIETNVPGRDADEELLHDLSTPWLLGLRRHSAIFREEGRPSNFVAGIAEACVRKSSQWASRFFTGSNWTDVSSAPAERLPPALLSRLMLVDREYLDVVPSAELVAKETTKLARYVDVLTRKGCKCEFFEMPMDSSLSDLSTPTVWRQALHRQFPNEKNRWLSFAHDHNYQTKDGVHLVRTEADRLTQAIIAATEAEVNQ